MDRFYRALPAFGKARGDEARVVEPLRGATVTFAFMSGLVQAGLVPFANWEIGSILALMA
ncbi:MAG: hypothetical protein WAM75_15710 [Xanthobacteraceae bacterium]